jgi:hypothetical protein
MSVRIGEQKKQMVEQTWLHYFNRTLYDQGYISESERNRLSLRIDNRRPDAPAITEQKGRCEPGQNPEQTMQRGDTVVDAQGSRKSTVQRESS